IISKYIELLKALKDKYSLPLLTGKSSPTMIKKVFNDFQKGALKIFAISDIGSYALDLPAASIAIQLSGHYGSKQEEAQRLGRIMRPGKDKQAIFYTVVSQNTIEQQYALKRQLFLSEQGYRYQVLRSKDL
ncbi:MAG TPA: helicase-related protein, partial [Spirochaetota bacterium]|nr:helicase-related protein [Spirochaetota bacterium]